MWSQLMRRVERCRPRHTTEPNCREQYKHLYSCAIRIRFCSLRGGRCRPRGASDICLNPAVSRLVFSPQHLNLPSITKAQVPQSQQYCLGITVLP